MKKLLIALLLVSGAAHAERWFEMENNAGGKIILTEYKCESNDKGKLVIATMKDGGRIEGCWFYYTEKENVA